MCPSLVEKSGANFEKISDFFQAKLIPSKSCHVMCKIHIIHRSAPLFDRLYCDVKNGEGFERAERPGIHSISSGDGNLELKIGPGESSQTQGYASVGSIDDSCASC